MGPSDTLAFRVAGNVHGAGGAGVVGMVREGPSLVWSLLWVLRLRQLKTGAAVKAV